MLVSYIEQDKGRLKGAEQIMTFEKTIKYAGLAIAGGAVGAAIGILIAPASGAETRKLITDRIESERADFLKRLRRDPRREEGYPYSVISA
ncbi:MAG: YtxH domain-containing protein [Vicinamibacteria bacterium]